MKNGSNGGRKEYDRRKLGSNNNPGVKMCEKVKCLSHKFHYYCVNGAASAC